ncbi:MAG: CoA transferase [Dehalococcoidia bacterium]|nr:CoA transferase [Dehalococcoidia bacterium]
MAALDGMNVLDLTQYEAGTTCTQYLAWFGARVVKIEPLHGEPGRASEGPGKDSLYFLSFNHNKRSVALDLASPEGREIFLAMLPKFDAVVENFALGAMDKLNLGYDVLKQHNPAIIYASIKGFGESGPYAGFKSFDWVAQAAGGAFSVTGEPDGPPMKPGATVGDTGSGMHAAMGVLAAYVQRLRTGEGQKVEVSMQETVFNFMRQQLSLRERRDGPVPRRGNKLGLPPTDLYPCAPGGSNDWAFIMPITSRMFDTLLITIDRPDLVGDPRFATVAERLNHGPELYEIISEWTRKRTKFEVMEALGAAGVPCSAVYDSDDLFRDKHLIARDRIVEYQYPDRGRVVMQAPPIAMSASKVDMVRAPLLGEHTVEVLQAELGLTDEQIAGLAQRGILHARQSAGAGAAAG